MRVRECKNQIVKILKEAEIESAFLEASIFIRKVTNWTKTQELINDQEEMEEEKAREAIRLAALRSQHIPTAYIIGEKEFYGLTFQVSPDCLIPRPDTETLVETALKAIEEHNYKTVLDLCTGSGAVGISLLANSDITLTQSDISDKALALAKQNASTLVPDKTITFIQSDLFSSIPNQKFDLIVSNPPYVTKEWYEETEEEIKKEPIIAFIDEAEDGLDLLRSIIKESVKYLNNFGMLAFECDYRQTKTCAKLLENFHFSHIAIDKDLNNKPRVVRGILCTQS